MVTAHSPEGSAHPRPPPAPAPAPAAVETTYVNLDLSVQESSLRRAAVYYSAYVLVMLIGAGLLIGAYLSPMAGVEVWFTSARPSTETAYATMVDNAAMSMELYTSPAAQAYAPYAPCTTFRYYGCEIDDLNRALTWNTFTVFGTTAMALLPTVHLRLRSPLAPNTSCTSRHDGSSSLDGGGTNDADGNNGSILVHSMPWDAGYGSTCDYALSCVVGPTAPMVNLTTAILSDVDEGDTALWPPGTWPSQRSAVADGSGTATVAADTIYSEAAGVNRSYSLEYDTCAAFVSAVCAPRAASGTLGGEGADFEYVFVPSGAPGQGHLHWCGHGDPCSASNESDGSASDEGRRRRVVFCSATVYEVDHVPVTGPSPGAGMAVTFNVTSRLWMAYTEYINALTLRGDHLSIYPGYTVASVMFMTAEGCLGVITIALMLVAYTLPVQRFKMKQVQNAIETDVSVLVEDLLKRRDRARQQQHQQQPQQQQQQQHSTAAAAASATVHPSSVGRGGNRVEDGTVWPSDVELQERPLPSSAVPQSVTIPTNNNINSSGQPHSSVYYEYGQSQYTAALQPLSPLDDTSSPELLGSGVPRASAPSLSQKSSNSSCFSSRSARTVETVESAHGRPAEDVSAAYFHTVPSDSHLDTFLSAVSERSAAGAVGGGGREEDLVEGREGEWGGETPAGSSALAQCNGSSKSGERGEAGTAPRRNELADTALYTASSRMLGGTRPVSTMAAMRTGQGTDIDNGHAGQGPFPEQVRCAAPPDEPLQNQRTQLQQHSIADDQRRGGDGRVSTAATLPSPDSPHMGVATTRGTPRPTTPTTSSPPSPDAAAMVADVTSTVVITVVRQQPRSARRNRSARAQFRPDPQQIEEIAFDARAMILDYRQRQMNVVSRLLRVALLFNVASVALIAISYGLVATAVGNYVHLLNVKGNGGGDLAGDGSAHGGADTGTGASKLPMAAFTTTYDYDPTGVFIGLCAAGLALIFIALVIVILVKRHRVY